MASKQTVRPRASKLDGESFDSLALEAEFLDRESKEQAAAVGLHPGRLQSKPEEQLGQRLQETREARRMTQGELSDLTRSLDQDGKGVSRAVISLYEAGTNRPSPRELRMLCEALKVTPSFFIYGNDDPFDSLKDSERVGSRSRSDPEGFAWMAHVFATLHHNHYDAIMKLALDLQRGWNKRFDQGLQDEANRNLIALAEELKERLKKRAATK